MSEKTSTLQAQERQIAALLYIGTRLASAVIGVGLLWQVLGKSLGGPAPNMPTGPQIITLGIGIFIGLPIVRVLVMLVMLLRERDYALSLVAAIVLGIIVSAAAAGLRMH
jgi:uncharacterized membrane protein